MYYLLPLAMLLTGCQFLPEIGKDIEDIATSTAIKIEISRDVFKKETDFQIIINVQKKD